MAINNYRRICQHRSAYNQIGQATLGYAPPRRPLNIVLINHEPESGSHAEQQLLAAGHSVLRVSRPQEAVRALNQRSVHLVLFDPMKDEAELHEYLAALRGAGGRVSARYTPVYALVDRELCESTSRIVDQILPIPLNVERLTSSYLSFLAEFAAMTRRGDYSAPCCEVEAAIDRLGGDVELFKDLVDRFLDDTAGTRRRIEAAIEELDGGQLHSASHSLKGLAASCGATAATLALTELESLGRQREFSAVPAAWDRFQVEMERTAETLAAYHRGSQTDSTG